MDGKMRKQIELAIIRLENENRRKFGILSFLHGKLSNSEVNELLDRINADRALVEKLKKGLEPGS